MLSSAFRNPIPKRIIRPRHSRFSISVATSPRSANQVAFSVERKPRNVRSAPYLSPDVPSKPISELHQGLIRNDFFDHWRAFWKAMEEAGSGSTVAHQDVRCHGPLYKMRKVELDKNPEAAKKQWHELCVAYDLKQETVMALYKENKKLKNEKKYAENENDCAEETILILQDCLERFYEAVEQLGQENTKLKNELRRIDEIRCDI
ncbi:hypothetical protein F4678DRAFT_6579 [Xylaria arbuscula]|nr:hypothetical protein F4678DRAFT_6579 [Xylaria arbuscula]